jgi:hypothetical protein
MTKKAISLPAVGAGIVVLAVLLTLVVMIFKIGQRSVSPAQAGSSSTSQPGGSASSVHPVTTSSTQKAAPPAATDTSKVRSTSKQIVQQYYLLFPTDTTAQRQARIAAAVDTGKMSNADFTVGANSCWDQARILYLLTEKAEVYDNSISIEPLEATGAHIIVSVPGTLKQYEKTGEDFAGTEACPSYQSFVAVLEWQFVKGKWTLVHFSNPERSP